MTHSPRISILRGLGYLLLLSLSMNCKKEHDTPHLDRLSNSSASKALTASTSTLSQTRTATLLNHNLAGIYVTNYSKNSKANDVASDDGVYASSNKLTNGDGYTLLVLQGFGFNIPANATIENISAKARRFKTGTGVIMEVQSSLVMRRERTDLPEWWSMYGARWADPNYFSSQETEISYSQSGTGVNYSGSYQWTPERVNDLYFGIMFQSDIFETSKGISVIKYDLVEINVEYSLP